MKQFIFGLIFSLTLMNVFAQKRTFTLEDLLSGGTSYTNFTPQTDYTIRLFKDNYLLLNEDSLFTVDPKNNEEKTFFLSSAELQKICGKETANVKQLAFEKIDGKHLVSLSFPKEHKRIYIDPDKKSILFEIQTNPDGTRNEDFSFQNKKFAFTKENNLYITDDTDGFIAISEESNPGIVYGQAVHRNEFGIHKGTFWSPHGNFLAFYRMDESMVEDYPLVDISAREAQLKNIKYPMAGMTSHEVTLGIYSLHSGQTIYMKTGEPKDHYLAEITWDPSEKYIYIAELNRDQNYLQLNKYDIRTGEKIQTLFEEQNEKYVEPENGLYFLKKTPDQFIWQSKRNGFNHLYLYNTDGKLLKQLTSGEYDITHIVGADEQEKNLFYVSNELNPIEFQVYKLALKSGKKTQLTFEPGVHNPSLSGSGKYMLDRYSNLENPLTIQWIDTEKPQKAITLQSADNPYIDYEMPEITLGSIPAADGKTDLYYRLLKPTGFDPEKKYPMVIYVYGGPHSQMVKNNWLGSARGWEIYMAQKGYVIFSMDNRGTSNRGLEFEQVTFRNLGVHETADQMEGVRFLKSLPYVDSERIGVHGWSYGGFMTANLLLRHPDVFKVGVAGGPVIDWKYYEVMYGERYMDSPKDNPEGYENTNMNNLAGNLKSRFLIIHGDEDPVVVLQHSLSFLKACITARTYPDYFIYPGHGHNMMGKDRIHLHEKITQYFEDYLK